MKSSTKWVLGIFLFFHILDVISTYLFWSVSQFEIAMELNFVVRFFGAHLGMAVLTVLLLTLIWLYDRYVNEAFGSFVVISTFLSLSLSKIIAITNNLWVYTHPPTQQVIDFAIQNPDIMTMVYFQTVLPLYLDPIVIAILGFVLLGKDYVFVKKEAKEPTPRVEFYYND